MIESLITILFAPIVVVLPPIVKLPLTVKLLLKITSPVTLNPTPPVLVIANEPDEILFVPVFCIEVFALLNAAFACANAPLA